MCFFLAVVLLAPFPAFAQILPHRAEYALRLGIAANAPRIGTIMQDITQDCSGWHIKRDISAEIPITTSWKISIASKLDGQERRNDFDYRTDQVQNGAERETTGKVRHVGDQLKADIVSPDGPAQIILPPPTLMPVAALGHLVDRLRAKAANFPALMFDAEVMGDAFLVDVTELEAGKLRPAPPADKPVKVPSETSWPVAMSFTRGRHQDEKPMFGVTAKIFDSGVFDRLTVDTGLVKLAADLQSLEMHKSPTCPGS